MHGRWFFWVHPVFYHSDVTLSAVVSIIFSAVCCVHIAEKHQSSVSLAFVKGIHRWPVTRKMLPFDDVNVNRYNSGPVIIWNTNSVVTVPADDAVTHRWCSNRLWITITHRDRFAAKFFWKHLIHYSYLFFHSITQALTIVSFCGIHRYEEIKTYGCSNGCTVSKIPHNSGCLHIVIVRDYSIENPLFSVQNMDMECILLMYEANNDIVEKWYNDLAQYDIWYPCPWISQGLSWRHCSLMIYMCRVIRS